MLQILTLACATVALALLACAALALVVMESGERAGVTKGRRHRG